MVKFKVEQYLDFVSEAYFACTMNMINEIKKHDSDNLTPK